MKSPNLHDLATDNSALEQTAARVDAMEQRLAEMEGALNKMGLFQCAFSKAWFKLPEEGTMVTGLGKPASWEGLAKLLEDSKMEASVAGPICEMLMLHHRGSLETVLRDHLGRPNGASKLAHSLGLRFPLKQSVGYFAQWLKANGHLR